MTFRSTSDCLTATKNQCLVCERVVIDGAWFERVGQEEWVVILCSRKCADAFHSLRLPFLRRVVTLTSLRLPEWNHRQFEAASRA